MSQDSHPDIRRTLLFLVRDGHILLAMKKRGFGAGKLNGVGGKIEPGETLEQATVRECQEEIGVTPRKYRLVAELDFVQEAATTEPWHMYGYVYLCEEWDGEPVETEEMRPEWFAMADIPYDNMWDDDRYWLPQVLEGHKVSATFTFDIHDKMTSHDVETVERLPYESQ